ncbi:MAG: hypothetical protein LBR69_00245 [Endomicrobium sp.]|jgi:hypothetical protein|nr:hypothetical protein [Endomicrobium sp.]
MKKILALAAVLAFTASSAFASESHLKKFKFFGEGSFYGYTYENTFAYPKYNFSGTGMYAVTGFHYGINENVSATFSLGYTDVWGDGLEGMTASDFFDVLRIVEANVTFKNLFDVEGLKLKVGRQYYGDEDSSVMYFGIRRNQPLRMLAGAGAYGAGTVGSISSVDGASAYYKKGNIKANIMYGIVANGGPNGNDTVMGGDFKYLNIADMFDAQAYLYSWDNLFYGQRKYTIFGLKPTFKKAGLKASLEFAKNFGGAEVFSNTADNTNLVKADVAYKIEKIGLTPRVMYGVFGGEFKGFYAFGNTNLGLIGGQTIISHPTAAAYFDNRIVNVGADYIKNKFTFSFDIFDFGSRDGKDNKDAVKYGTEFDLVVKYAYDANTDFYAGIGHMFGGKAAEAINDNAAFDSSTFQAGVTYKFK